MEAKLTVRNLSKKYRQFVALAPTNFSLNSGEIVTLSGQNGSGKTTLLSCITGLVRATTGTVHVGAFELSEDELEVRRRLAFVPDVSRFYVELTAWEHLRFIAMANDVLEVFEIRAEEILRGLGLWDVRDQFPHNYSRGMQLKLGLAMAFIRPFEVLLLDEPTSALDEESVSILLDKLRILCQHGASILMSSHDPAIKTQFGDRQLLIENGVLREV
ncbi:MAG: ABC transporter ATP-binding protein [Chloroflexota bacterium]|nr:ABC transporter ATP-binding protein [Chloroflexota bacterium]